MKSKVFVTHLIPGEALSIILETFDTEVWPDKSPPSRNILLKKVRGCEGLLTMVTERVDKVLLDAAGPQLKVVSNYAVGYDNIDVAACTRRGIPVGNTPDVLTDTTADFAFALIMAAARRVVEAHLYVRTGQWKVWDPSLFLGHDIHSSTLGIIGYGRIGRGVVKRAQGFDMRVLYCDPIPCADEEASQWADRTDLEELLRQADFVTLHTPLTSETYHLIGDREFKLMKETAILINTSRGPVVDPKALYRALKDGEIAYAALDVTEPEPISTDDPLLKLDNCLVVPHIASASHATRRKMTEMAVANLLAGLRGERLPTCVNPEVYEHTDFHN
jgi:lactate dehydrogenase-like 2-hydroxyacid dehydrogenase